MNRHITSLESVTTDCFDGHVETTNVLRQQCAELMISHSNLADNVNYLIKQVQGMQHEWEAWNEWPPIDQDQEEETPFRDLTYQSMIVVPSVEQPCRRSQEQPTLLDLTPVSNMLVNYCTGLCKWVFKALHAGLLKALCTG